ncbi:MAG: 50S ribosomal protein L18 [candidate division WOR-3 bacterium]|nr:50S ribosomal protein L18 [candidate division WOR-3 bacterium]
MRLIGRIRRHRRIRKKIIGTPQRPRLCVFRSNRHIYAQLIDDTKGVVLCGVSSIGLNTQGKKKTEIALEVGKKIGEIALNKGIKCVCFDRAGYKYHGRVKALAEGARQSGLKF